MEMSKIWSKLFLLGSLAISWSEVRAATPGDYDGDGRADIAIIDADEGEDKTTVFVRQSSNGRTVPNVFFPFGDFVISGSYFGDGKTYPGVVSNHESGATLEWHIKNSSGSEAVLNYGLKGDVVPNQSDLDCDGITDFAVVRPGTADFYPGFRLWYISLSSSGGAILETVFGVAGDEMFTGDVDGDGCAEMIALRPSSYHWISKKISNDTLTVVQWGLPGDIPMLPRDMNGDGNPDYIISRIVGRSQVAYVRLGAGSATSSNLGTSGSIPFVGNFYGSNTFGWFERSKSKMSLRTPSNSTSTFSYGNPRRGVLRSDGTEVTEFETGRF